MLYCLMDCIASDCKQRFGKKEGPADEATFVKIKHKWQEMETENLKRPSNDRKVGSEKWLELFTPVKASQEKCSCHNTSKIQQ